MILINVWRLISTTTLVLISIIPLQCLAQDKPATSAADVLQKYVEALGGEMALQSLEAIEYEGTIDSAGTPGTFYFLHGQGKCTMTVNLSGQPEVRAGFDGKYLWQQRGDVGFKNPAERFVGLGIDLPGTPMTALEWLELKDESTLLESRRVGERMTDVIRIEMPEGQSVTGFFDQESGLLVQAIYGEGDVATEYRLEYADELIEGLRCVNKATASVAGVTRFVWDVNNTVANPELEGDEFSLPGGLIEGEPGGG